MYKYMHADIGAKGIVVVMEMENGHHTRTAFMMDE